MFIQTGCWIVLLVVSSPSHSRFRFDCRTQTKTCLPSSGHSWGVGYSALPPSSSSLAVFSFPLPLLLPRSCLRTRRGSRCGISELGISNEVLACLGFCSSQPNDQLDCPPGLWCTLTLVFCDSPMLNSLRLSLMDLI